MTPRVVAHLKTCRDALVPQLQALPQVRVEAAKGGMYAFFKLDGFDDSLAVAKRLVAEAGLGLAPGNAFAPEAAGLAALVLRVQGRGTAGAGRGASAAAWLSSRT